jgi:type III restriction enzyme
MIKKAAAARWCRAVNNDGRYGNWAYRLCFGATELKGVFDTMEHDNP